LAWFRSKAAKAEVCIFVKRESMFSQQKLIYILLGIAILTFIFWTIRDWLIQQRERHKTTDSHHDNKSSVVLPLQLQAYERLVVLTERISPEQLINRLNQPEFSARAMQQLLVQTIKAEYDHNVSQQVYVSKEAWDAVKNAKEQLISLINRLAAQLPEQATALELNKKLLELMLKNETAFPTQTAQEILSQEAKKLMRNA